MPLQAHTPRRPGVGTRTLQPWAPLDLLFTAVCHRREVAPLWTRQKVGSLIFLVRVGTGGTDDEMVHYRELGAGGRQEGGSSAGACAGGRDGRWKKGAPCPVNDRRPFVGPYWCVVSMGT